MFRHENFSQRQGNFFGYFFLKIPPKITLSLRKFSCRKNIFCYNFFYSCSEFCQESKKSHLENRATISKTRKTQNIYFLTPLAEILMIFVDCYVHQPLSRIGTFDLFERRTYISPHASVTVSRHPEKS